MQYTKSATFRTFMSLQLVVAPIMLCQASSVEAIPSSPSLDHPKAWTDIFTEAALDQALRDTLSEVFIVLAVFGTASAVLSGYRKHARKTSVSQKANCVSFPGDSNKGSAKKSARGNVGTAESSRQTSDASSAALGKAIQASCQKLSSTPTPASVSSKKPRQSDSDSLVSAVKMGKASQLPELLDAALKRSLSGATKVDNAEAETIASQLLLSALRACAAARCFNDAVAAYEHFAKHVGEGNASLWSVLLYSVVEAGVFKHAKEVYSKLCKLGAPSEHDFVNMVRCFAGQQDAIGLKESLEDFRRNGHTIDSYTWNRALAACGTSEYALDLADVLVSASIADMDAVGYNTLIKYNGRAGRVARCFELRAEMLAKDIQPSEVTYGVLLEACVAAKELERAREVFSDLCSSGLRLNVVHCTTFIKVLVAARMLDEAAKVLDEMIGSPGVKPDLISFSIIVKAYAEAGDVASSLRMVDLMRKEGVKPDEILFNSVLSGCFAYPLKSTEVMRTFEILRGHGLKPSSTTLSILLKGLAHTAAWETSLQVLKDAPSIYGLQPEGRLYAQLAQACVKAQESRTVLTVLDAMFEDWRRQGKGMDKEAICRFLRNCLLGRSPELSAELRQRMRRAGVVIDAQMEKMFETRTVWRS